MPIIDRNHPGGHRICRPPNKWMCKWATSWHPSFPSFTTSRYPLVRPTLLAIVGTLTIIWPKIALWDGWACCQYIHTCEMPESPSLILGMIRIWTGAWGLISLKAYIWMVIIVRAHLRRLPAKGYSCRGFYRKSSMQSNGVIFLQD